MSIWFYLVPYFLGFPWGFRISFKSVARDLGCDDPDWSDVFMFLLIGFIGGLICPLLYIILIFKIITRSKDPNDLIRKIAGESRKDKLARREEELKKREKEISKLEHEVGII